MWFKFHISIVIQVDLLALFNLLAIIQIALTSIRERKRKNEKSKLLTSTKLYCLNNIYTYMYIYM